ncbi:phage virion morphogenesis protein [Tenacibaculum finnmarkense genomovar finnmarkense]|uniref:phage virion morphogenesis protein n=1 Tax=Tenacibaculum finnmarkense TaxID=2781243 RepID=UPI001EFB5420|nr:phage virion morphogenesis protein [Tenacibaculum finnmarkense]MCG8186700.1 phage virion morphogenesis protein [Tenacibaculum finnmarkense genomovar finnmarkense]MCG8203651.1 phage virion morphogenesis protein [Tenacibaculum finnmarkense genomovar finnmarkense]MCG8210607.1 phage virion morphogenesis protein [Tenacibaculum finnmarkense genomovar finnmarkense]MCG8213500.1 phage virion morphogenesis protein [Tenacibaculum finnmarkense genomovar finnmarkense]MCG8226309.1 phage virion morphogene
MSVKFKGDFFEKLQRIDNKFFLSKMTSEAGVIAVKFSKDRFRQKNWVDTSQEKWTPRKRKRAGSLLVGPGSGRLKRSIRKISEGKYYVLIGTDVPYAQIHNEGGTIKATARVRAHSRTRKGRNQPIKVKAHTRQMNAKIPKRQFLGESAVLARRLENHMYDKVTDEIYKK